MELGWYNLSEGDLAFASELDRWLFWLLHAQEYDVKTLQRLFPQPALVQATGTIDRIARVTEDKDMYDLREKGLRDQRWMINSSIRHGLEQGLEQGRAEGIEQCIEQGRVEGQQEGLKMGVDLGKLLCQINSFQNLLGLVTSSDQELMNKDLEELKSLGSDLENQLRRNLRI